jgi:hypothetical protein
VKNDDVWLDAAMSAWKDVAERYYIWDTGSGDDTRDRIKSLDRDLKRCDSTLSMSFRDLTVDQSMGVRHDQILEAKGYFSLSQDTWLVVVDADEVWPESQIIAMVEMMGDPEIDHIGVRPIPIGWDGKTMFETCQVEPYVRSDQAIYTTPYWCPKCTLRAHRINRLDGVSDPRWGHETFYTKWDPDRHTKTDDFKETNVPEGTVASQFTGRCKFTDIWYCHMSYVQRSSRLDLRNTRRPFQAQFKLPETHAAEVPQSVLETLASMEKPFA